MAHPAVVNKSAARLVVECGWGKCFQQSSERERELQNFRLDPASDSKDSRSNGGSNGASNGNGESKLV